MCHVKHIHGNGEQNLILYESGHLSLRLRVLNPQMGVLK